MDGSLPSKDDPMCGCGHLGPDRQGEHTGAPWCELMKRATCTHPGCICKGFGNRRAALDFLMDERLGGP
jgi:hypothetical protein